MLVYEKTAAAKVPVSGTEGAISASLGWQDKLDPHFSLRRSAEPGTIAFCKAKKAASMPRGDSQELECGRGKKAALHVTSRERARLKEHAAEVEVLPDAFGRDKSFCNRSQVGQCLQSSRTHQRQVTQLMDSLVIDCLLSALQPQLVGVQHTEVRLKKTLQSSPASRNCKGLRETEQQVYLCELTAASPPPHQSQCKTKGTIRSQQLAN